jgi:hypothetical protein
VRKLSLLLAAGAVSALVLALSAASMSAQVWTAALSSGQEVPKQTVRDTAAHGLFKGTLSGHKLKWRLTFAKLTGPALQAHIHKAPKGKAGPIVVALCAPCKNGQTGTSTAYREEPERRDSRPTRQGVVKGMGRARRRDRRRVFLGRTRRRSPATVRALPT